MLRQAHDLLHARLHAVDGVIGRVRDLYVDDHRWTVRYLVVDTGSSLLPRTSVLISPISVLRTDPGSGALDVALTMDQVRHSPDVDTDRPLARQYEIRFNEYFDLPYYWLGGQRWGTASHPEALRRTGRSRGAAGPEGAGDGDPHLRSVRTMAGYLVQAIDAEVGRLEDFLVDEPTWAIRYLVVDAGHWPHGRHVPVPAEWIAWVSWLEQRLHVSLAADRIEHASPYDPSRPPGAEDEARLHAHYGEPAAVHRR